MTGKITEITGPVSFHVRLEDGRVRRCHQDQLMVRVTGPDSTLQEVIEEKSAHDDVAMAIPISSSEVFGNIASSGGGTNSELTSGINRHVYPSRNWEAPKRFQSST